MVSIHTSEAGAHQVTPEFGINLAIGPNCPTLCQGCYNVFTSIRPSVCPEEIFDFLDTAKSDGVAISKITVSGGDPLHHPDIIDILAGLHAGGYRVQLDTVGTVLLEAAPIVYQGKGTAPKIDIRDIAPHVGIISLPLEGIDNATIHAFRTGRPRQFEEIVQAAKLVTAAGVKLGINTLVNAYNVSQLTAIRDIVVGLGATVWQLFQYEPEIPADNIQPRSWDLAIRTEDFLAATESLRDNPVRTDIKTRHSRDGSYFLVNSWGMAWQPNSVDSHRNIGHITRHRDLALQGLRQHYLRVMGQPFSDVVQSAQ